MHCIRCGKQLPPGAVFCAHCGAKQTVGAASAAKGGQSGTWIAVASAVAGLAILGGAGYWAWINQAAKDADTRSVAEQPVRPVSAPAAQPRLSAEETAERAEIAAAQAALARHIMEEEAKAKARAGLK